MYNIEEIKEIIDNAVSEECKNYNDSSPKGYISVQSLKTRLYDAFGIEDNDNNVKLMKVRIINATLVTKTASPWYRDEIGKIYTVSNKKVDMGLGFDRMCYAIVQDGISKRVYIQCCDCEIVD